MRIPTALLVSLDAAFCAAGLHADPGMWMLQQLHDGKKSAYLDVALGDVPVNFLSTVATPGGNSGSPTLNGRGELVGLLFDGTNESVASNYRLRLVTTRSIHVDSGYMLWNMADVDGSINLLREMGITASQP